MGGEAAIADDDDGRGVHVGVGVKFGSLALWPLNHVFLSLSLSVCVCVCVLESYGIGRVCA